jgi:hypothetical protein
VEGASECGFVVLGVVNEEVPMDCGSVAVGCPECDGGGRSAGSGTVGLSQSLYVVVMRENNLHRCVFSPSMTGPVRWSHDERRYEGNGG